MTYTFKRSTWVDGILRETTLLNKTSEDVHILTSRTGVEAGYVLANTWNRQAHIKNINNIIYIYTFEGLS